MVTKVQVTLFRALRSILQHSFVCADDATFRKKLKILSKFDCKILVIYHTDQSSIWCHALKGE